MQITLMGYYGQKNLGDDLMLTGLLNLLNEKLPEGAQVNVWALQNHYSFSFSNIKVKVLAGSGIMAKLRRHKSLFASDLIIWGGGTPFYEVDKHDFGSNLQGLQNILKLIKRTKKFRSRWIFAGVGIGTLQSEEAKSCLKNIFAAADQFIFRDSNSFRIYQEMGGNHRKSVLSDDLVFLNDYNIDAKKQEGLNISFTGIYYFSQEDKMVQHYAGMLKQWIDKENVKIHFLPAQNLSSQSDNAFHQKIADLLPKENMQIHNWKSEEEFISILSKMDVHIGMRLHSVVLADILGIPNMAIEYSPKLAYYLEEIGEMKNERLKSLGDSISIEEIKAVKEKYPQQKIAGIVRERRSRLKNTISQLLFKK